MAVIVDTNVAFVADGNTRQADQACGDVCIERLLAIMQSGGLLLDEDDAIVAEYIAALGHSGRPGVGRAFVKWAFDYRFDAARCGRVSIRQRADGGWRRYEEFPNVPALEGFDPSDQKFVAVAIASGVAPPILNAVDSDWWSYKTSLVAAGITVEFLCPHLLRHRWM